MGRGSGVTAASKTSIKIDFRYKGQRCREKLRLPPTAANKKYAEQLKATIEREITLGIFDYAKYFPDSKRALRLSATPSKALTVGELLDAWIASIKGEVEPETWDNYGRFIRNVLKPAFGDKRLEEITLRLVKTWAGEQPFGKKRLLNVLTPLRRALAELAVDEQYITADPLAGFSLKRVETTIEEDDEDEIDPFTPEEIASVLAVATLAEQNLYETWVWTGLRSAELCALTWSDVDFDRGIARINKARRGSRIKQPKTKSGIREVRLLPPAIAALRRQREITGTENREVFINPKTGLPYTGDRPLRRAWAALLLRAKIRYRYPYQLRHTYASWMLSGGENPLWVARQMGHKDWYTIVKTYGRWIPDVDPEAGKRAFRRISALFGASWARFGHDPGEASPTDCSDEEIWCRLRDLNPRPAVYKTAALPLS